MVMNSHYAHYLFNGRSFLNFMWTGVYLFFVISGFVFAKTILYKDISVTSFAIRRFFRIYPLYAFSLVLFYFFVGDAPQKVTFFIRHLFFLNTAVSIKETFFFNPAYWSLPPEVEFYMSIPLLILLRKKLGVKSIFLLFPALLCIKFLIAFMANDPSTTINAFNLLSVHLPGKAPEFFVGIMLFRAYEHSLKTPVHFLYPFLSFASGTCILCSLGWYFVEYGDAGINEYIILKAFFTVFCAFGYALILYAGLILFRKEKASFYPYALFLGSISYSMYLFHNLIPLVIAKMGITVGQRTMYLLCSLLVLLMSIACSRYIENPCRDFGKKTVERINPG